MPMYSACVLFVDVDLYRLTVRRQHGHYCICSYCHNTMKCTSYASVRMHRRHTVVGLCVSHSVILYVCNSVFSEVTTN